MDKAAKPNTPVERPRKPSSRPKGIRRWSTAVFGVYAELSLGNKIMIWSLVAMIPLGFLGLKLMRPVYRDWKQGNALAAADRYLATGDYKAASMAFQQALQANPRNARAWERVAQWLDGMRSAESIEIWRRLTKMEPEQMGHRYALVSAALRHNEQDVARLELAGVPEANRNDPQYHKLAASLAAAGRRYDDAIGHLTRANEIAPEDRDAAFNLAMVQIASGTPETRIAAIAQLEEMRKPGSSNRREATRELVKLHRVMNQTATARRLARELLAIPGATFDDRLLSLEVEAAAAAAGPLSASSLRSTQLIALGDPEDIAKLARWMMRHGMANEAKAWLDAIPESHLPRTTDEFLEVEFAVGAQDWPKFFEMLRNGEVWQLSPESVELIEQAWKERSAGDAGAISTWQTMLRGIRSNPVALELMVRIADAWKWEEASEGALWELANSQPRYVPAWASLVQRHVRDGRLDKLRDALEGLTKASPNNIAFKHDWAKLTLLLRRDGSGDAFKAAEAVYETERQNPSFASTYALGLMQQGRADEAVSVMRRLPPEQLDLPGAALYYGAALVRAGDSEMGMRFLGIAAQVQGQFTAPERELFDESLAYAKGEKLLPKQEEEVLRAGRYTDEDVRALMAELRSDQKPRSPEEQDEMIKAFQSAIRERALTPDEARELLEGIRHSKGEQAVPAE